MTLAGAGLAVATEMRNRSALRADPLWDLLGSPLEGEPVPVTSADGAILHAEVFGPENAPTFVLIPGWTENLQFFDLLTRGLLGHGGRRTERELEDATAVGGRQLRDLATELQTRLHKAADTLDKLTAAGWAARPALYDLILSREGIDTKEEATRRLTALGVDPEELLIVEELGEDDEEIA